ncbi:26S proteasome non-ATPase regulatory subunit 5 isoform X2 [Salvelinus namaycush]|uniref:26S proteasome non-ATPase regulatory subunit 5 n=1 Tax=Salvelinus namaycush TaxID=8040 RepID=A0A8U0PJ37_SALNM|nr:26S proteasome non-ATPase regulatory subunit 5 isoform X2 [Salvelinus namaycush]
MAASIESLFVEIASLEEPIEELQTLKTAVLSIPVSALRDTVSGLRLEVIFSLLNTNDREKIELCVDILGRILLALSPVHLAQNCRVELQAGLKHPDDTVKILALTQLIVDISSVSPVSLGYCANSSFISQLLGELTGDDVLVRATAIEMVTTLSHSQHGRQYLAQQGIMDKISNMITGAKSDPFSSFYLPGLVKFFGNLAIMDSPQHVCETYPAFQNKVFEMTIDPDPVMTGVALDTLGILGSTVEGKQVLQKTGEKFHAVLKRMSQLASGGATELRVRCLEAISLLITLQAEQQTEDLLVLTESWFHLLSNQPMEMIRNISTQPFPELHCRALRIFTAIASQPWGQRLMIGTPGFMEFIVDRSTGPTKEAKDAKFELVGALVSSSTAADILGSQHYLRLRSYLREGAYYVTAVATVTTEGAD